ncbi:MAG: hypothetical protein IMW83_03810 [Caldanaerobacter subterraneus]|nr:hypothetical protein [Caldanaerobacter subterraneus]
MLTRAYFSVRGKILSFFNDKKAVSQSIEVIGIVALVAGVLTLIIPQARTTVVNIWNTVLATAQNLFTNASQGK